MSFKQKTGWHQISEVDLPKTCPKCGAELKWIGFKGLNHRIVGYALYCAACNKSTDWRKNPEGLVRLIHRRPKLRPDLRPKLS